MLFNSYSFIFLFLPVTLAVFFLLGKIRPALAAFWLVVASLIFYGLWSQKYLALLVGSIVCNYAAGRLILWLEHQPALRKGALIVSVTANLALLGYYKYSDFFISVANKFGADHALLHTILPLGISFYTFTQIAFLVDAYQAKVNERQFTHYALFVTYFPHLIAGPIFHHAEIMPQFARPEIYKPNYENLSVGITIFVIGLFKKVVLADNLALFVGSAFSTSNPGFFDAWCGTLAYSFQIYFDFSGYSDMAIGIARMFGIRFPLNFNSPYKAANIIEFWRRWHMTLSRFLRDYLYIPLGGNKKGPFRRYLNLIITMVLGGFWHGAGWTFVEWGLLHGLYFGVNHWFIKIKKRFPHPFFSGMSWHIIACLLTFLAVTVGWVFFRADSGRQALVILKSMMYVYGPGNAATDFSLWAPWVLTSFVIVWFMPNTQELMRNHRPGLDFTCPQPSPGKFCAIVWQPSVSWFFFVSLIFCASLAMLSGTSPFLYFQF